MLTRKLTTTLGALALAFAFLTTTSMAVTVLVDHADALAWEGHATYPGFDFDPVTAESDENILHAEFDVSIAGLTDGGIFSRWMDAGWNVGNNEWMNMFTWYAWDPSMGLGATIWSAQWKNNGATDATQKTHTWHCSATIDLGSTPKTHNITASDTEGDGEYSFAWTSDDSRVNDNSQPTSIGYIQWELQSAIGSEPPPTVSNVLVVSFSNDEKSSWRAIADLQSQIDNIQLTPGPQGPQGKAGADGAAGTNGSAGAAGADGTAGADGADGTAGADGADGENAPCVSCEDVASAAVDLACLVLGENPPASIADLRAGVDVIVASLMISANLCEGECDLSSQIDDAIATKLGE